MKSLFFVWKLWEKTHAYTGNTRHPVTDSFYQCSFQLHPYMLIPPSSHLLSISSILFSIWLSLFTMRTIERERDKNRENSRYSQGRNMWNVTLHTDEVLVARVRRSTSPSSEALRRTDRRRTWKKFSFFFFFFFSYFFFLSFTEEENTTLRAELGFHCLNVYLCKIGSNHRTFPYVPFV